MRFIYLGFDNRTFFRSDLRREENREPIYHTLACNIYVDEVKVKKA